MSELIHSGQEILSPISRNKYVVLEQIGRGAFGETFLALHKQRGQAPFPVCVKTLTEQRSWHREAYFGELLQGWPRVIPVLDAFPLPITVGATTHMFFALVFPYASNGSLGDYLEKKGPWPEKRARTEIVALLKALSSLHRSGVLHRDLTPGNVLVGDGGHLYLADFGIARQAVGDKPIAADAFAPWFVTKGILNNRHRYWLAVDDVFQMGQILALLLWGDASCTICAKEISKLDCSDELKDILRRAIGPRSSRYEDAFQLLQALQGSEGADPVDIRSLKGLKIAFTGPLSIKRFDASLMVLQAGGTVVRRITKRLNVLVVGGKSPLYQHGNKGKKLLAAERLNREGARIRIMGERQFLTLTKN
jgi:serine/threonine protein kinase